MKKHKCGVPALKFDLRKLKKAVRVCKSVRAVARYFNNIRSHQYFSKIIKENNLDTSHFIFGDRSCYIGKTFNSLTIKKIYWDKKDIKHERIMCVCDCACGNIGKIKRLDDVITGRVLSCGCASKNRKSMQGNKNHQFKGVGKLGYYYFNWVILSGAKKRKIPFKVDIKYLWNLFVRQGKKCAYTGFPLHFGRTRNSHETNASLDRIDSSKGYIKGNVQWVLKDINRMKMYYSSDYFIKLCKMVTKYNNKKDRERVA